MFDTIDNLVGYYGELERLVFNYFETMPKKLFNLQNKEILKRFKTDYKKLKKFEKRELYARNKYWHYREINDKVNAKKWYKLICFLHLKRQRTTYEFLKKTDFNQKQTKAIKKHRVCK